LNAWSRSHHATSHGCQSSVHTPYMEVWQESKTTELSVRESACTTSELLPKCHNIYYYARILLLGRTIREAKRGERGWGPLLSIRSARLEKWAVSHGGLRTGCLPRKEQTQS
jgi:hypothetical protein